MPRSRKVLPRPKADNSRRSGSGRDALRPRDIGDRILDTTGVALSLHPPALLTHGAAHGTDSAGAALSFRGWIVHGAENLSVGADSLPHLVAAFGASFTGRVLVVVGSPVGSCGGRARTPVAPLFLGVAVGCGSHFFEIAHQLREGNDTQVGLRDHCPASAGQWVRSVRV